MGHETRAKAQNAIDLARQANTNLPLVGAFAVYRLRHKARLAVLQAIELTENPPTIRDVARAVGLSVASVSRAMNGHANVHPDTRARVIEVARQLGYTPNAAARSLSTSRSHAIGVVLPDLHGEFFSELVRGMDKAASESGYLLLLSNMHADSALAGQAMNAMRGRVDGLIVMAPQLGEAELKLALPGGMPAVLVNSPNEAGRHALRVDNAGGARAMVTHLLEAGRRRIVHIAGIAGNRDAEERRQGYLDAMAALAPDLPVRVIDGDFHEDSGERTVRELIAGGQGFDAIFAANDMMALGALTALAEAGMDVPGQVAVAGFDDVPLARYLKLTTMRVDMAGIGGNAVARLVEELARTAGPAGLDSVEPELLIRASTTKP